jgi:hypothetical protein
VVGPSSALDEIEPERYLLIGEDGRLLLGDIPIDVADPQPTSAPPGMRTLLGLDHIGDFMVDVADTDHPRLFQDARGQAVAQEAQQEEGMTREARIMSAVAQATAVVQASLDTDVILARVVEYACLLFNVSSAAVLLPAPLGPYVVGSCCGLQRATKDTGLSAEMVRRLSFEVPVPLLIPDLSCLSSVPYFEDVASQGLAEAVVLPLITDTGMEGIFILQDRRRFHLRRIDLEALKIFGSHAAAALRNAERYRTERSAGEVLRETILALPREVPSVTFSHRYHAATRDAAVGGDFYDIFQTNGRIGLVIGDVSGKGVGASATTLLARTSTRAYAQLDPSPSSVLGRLNSLLCHDTPRETFVTLGYFLLDPSTGLLDYGVAGHPPALLKRAGGGVEALEHPASPLGIFPGRQYCQKSVQLFPRDIVFVYTDGLTEARRRRYMFGERRLIRHVKKAEQDPHRLIAAISRALYFYCRGDYRDDVALFAMAYEPESDSV